MPEIRPTRRFRDGAEKLVKGPYSPIRHREGPFMLELYHNDMSTCAQKVRFALAEKGENWQSHHLDLRARDQQRPEYLRLNTNAVVPTLVHDGTVIIESTVINEYIDEAFPGPALRPADAIGRARMRLWTKQLDEGLHADTGVLSPIYSREHGRF
jgi:glutathione S-transferase